MDHFLETVRLHFKHLPHSRIYTYHEDIAVINLTGYPFLKIEMLDGFPRGEVQGEVDVADSRRKSLYVYVFA